MNKLLKMLAVALIALVGMIYLILSPSSQEGKGARVLVEAHPTGVRVAVLQHYKDWAYSTYVRWEKGGVRLTYCIDGDDSYRSTASIEYNERSSDVKVILGQNSRGILNLESGKFFSPRGQDVISVESQYQGRSDFPSYLVEGRAKGEQ